MLRERSRTNATLTIAALALGLVGVVVSCAGGGRDLASTGGAADTGGLQAGDGGVLADDAASIGLEAGPAYAVLGVQPSHGPFGGGTRVEVRGRGFSSQTRVLFGSVEVPASSIVVTDPSHLQAVTPAGDPGLADVTVIDQVSAAHATLAGGFTYDDFYATPDNGATSGGTHVVLTGRGTTWGVGTTATIDGKACTDLAVDDATHLRCTAPAGTPGVKAITVKAADGTVDTARDAYTYADTIDGYRGGLDGAALPGELRVLALDGSGTFVPGATVVVRGADAVVQTKLTDAGGLADFPAPPAAPVTVTIAAKCLQPQTFDGVRVRSVTAYLDPVMSVACVPPEGQPAPSGGKSWRSPLVNGELVWRGGSEFMRAPWNGVAAAFGPSQRRAAYVFVAYGDALARFQLPDPSVAVTETSAGTVGYAYTLGVPPGNLTLYAVAGIETHPDGGAITFEPWMFGVVRGVAVPPESVVDRVMIPMDGSFTRGVSLTPIGAPFSSRGPDRLESSITVDLGGVFMPIPYGAREDLLPIAGDLSFVGVPPLTGALAASSYSVSVQDVNGGAGGAPLSAIVRVPSRNASTPIPVGPFVPIPHVVTPAASAAWDGHTVSLAVDAGGPFDLLKVTLTSGDGSTTWTIVTPGSTRAIELPTLGAELGLPHGTLNLGVWAARIDGFDYGRVRYGQLSRYSWNAYAYDFGFGRY
jgi:hypothetical protein